MVSVLQQLGYTTENIIKAIDACGDKSDAQIMISRVFIIYITSKRRRINNARYITAVVFGAFETNVGATTNTTVVSITDGCIVIATGIAITTTFNTTTTMLTIA
jgi:hypothetical protein